MLKTKISVMIVEDSPMYQAYLKKIIEEDKQLEVKYISGTKKETLDLLKGEKPDVITLDLNLPDVNELELLKILVDTTNLPIIVVTSIAALCEQAIQIGAKDFIEKLNSGSLLAREQFALLFRLKIKTQVSVFGGIKAASKNLLTGETSHRNISDHLIVIGASLGGTEATLAILKEFPEWMPATVVVQHMPAEFTNAYAMRLNRNCKVKVREAKNGEKLEKGTVLVARGGEQIEVYKSLGGYRIRSFDDKKESVFSPSVNVLFQSVAKAAENKAIGIILTGMGNDGAKGMKRMHDKGAFTIAQDKQSCAVFGMPNAAYEAGAVDKMLPLKEISSEIINRFKI